MKESERVEDYGKYTADVDELDQAEIKINPNYYIHTGIVSAQQALSNADIKQGFAQFVMIIATTESIAKAAKVLGNDYEQKVKDYMEKDEYKKAERQDLMISKQKLQYMLEAVFASRTSTAPLQLGEKRKADG